MQRTNPARTRSSVGVRSDLRRHAVARPPSRRVGGCGNVAPADAAVHRLDLVAHLRPPPQPARARGDDRRGPACDARRVRVRRIHRVCRRCARAPARRRCVDEPARRVELDDGGGPCAGRARRRRRPDLPRSPRGRGRGDLRQARSPLRATPPVPAPNARIHRYPIGHRVTIRDRCDRPNGATSRPRTHAARPAGAGRSALIDT